MDYSVCVWIGGELAWVLELLVLWPRLGPLLTECSADFLFCVNKVCKLLPYEGENYSEERSIYANEALILFNCYTVFFEVVLILVSFYLNSSIKLSKSFHKKCILASNQRKGVCLCWYIKITILVVSYFRNLLTHSNKAIWCLIHHYGHIMVQDIKKKQLYSN